MLINKITEIKKARNLTSLYFKDIMKFLTSAGVSSGCAIGRVGGESD